MRGSGIKKTRCECGQTQLFLLATYLMSHSSCPCLPISIWFSACSRSSSETCREKSVTSSCVICRSSSLLDCVPSCCPITRTQTDRFPHNKIPSAGLQGHFLHEATPTANLETLPCDEATHMCFRSLQSSGQVGV